MNRIEHFNWVRDIPYSIPTTESAPDYCCEGKHKVLEKLLRGTGLKTREGTCVFQWSDLKQIPEEIIGTPHQDRMFHGYLQVQMDGIWYNIDATWDSRQRVLPVNQWNGRIGTRLAVRAIKTTKLEQAIIGETISFEENMRRNGEFYEKFNRWLEDSRRK